MDKLDVSKGTVYGYVDFGKLDSTLNVRQKEPSERTDEEIELLESSLSENRSLVTGGSEDLDRGKYERERARGFPALKKKLSHNPGDTPDLKAMSALHCRYAGT